MPRIEPKRVTPTYYVVSDDMREVARFACKLGMAVCQLRRINEPHHLQGIKRPTVFILNLDYWESLMVRQGYEWESILANRNASVMYIEDRRVP